MDVERLSPKQRGWLAAPGRCSAASTPEPLAVSHRPKAVPARVCECYGEWRGTLPVFPADVNARHDKMVGLVERMEIRTSLHRRTRTS